MNVALCFVNIPTVVEFFFIFVLFGLGRVGKGEHASRLFGIQSKVNM